MREALHVSDQGVLVVDLFLQGSQDLSHLVALVPVLAQLFLHLEVQTHGLSNLLLEHLVLLREAGVFRPLTLLLLTLGLHLFQTGLLLLLAEQERLVLLALLLDL